MAIALVSASGPVTVNAAANSSNLTWVATTTAGNLLIACVAARASGLGYTVPTISAATSFVKSVDVTKDSGIKGVGAIRVAIYYYANCNAQASTGTWTVNASGTKAISIDAAEYSGLTGGGSLDQAPTGNSGNSASVTTGTTGTTATADELLIGFLGSLTSSTWSSLLNSFTSEATTQATSFSTIMLRRIVAATSTYSTGATASTSGNWGGIIATFQGTASPVARAYSSTSGGGILSQAPNRASTY